MARLFSAQLFAVHAGAAATVTPAPGEILIVRDIEAFNGSAFTPETAALVVLPSNATAFQVQLPPSNWTHVDCRIVIPQGQSIGTANGPDVDMVVSGYVLTTP